MVPVLGMLAFLGRMRAQATKLAIFIIDQLMTMVQLTSVWVHAQLLTSETQLRLNSIILRLVITVLVLMAGCA